MLYRDYIKRVTKQSVLYTVSPGYLGHQELVHQQSAENEINRNVLILDHSSTFSACGIIHLHVCSVAIHSVYTLLGIAKMLLDS